MHLTQILQSRSASELREYVAERFDWLISDLDAEAILMYLGEGSSPYSLDDLNIAWLKNRLAEVGAVPLTFTAPPPFREESYRFATCRLHTFFLCLEETEEMQDRLRGVSKSEPRWERCCLADHDTEFLHPIDELAFKVDPDRTKPK